MFCSRCGKEIANEAVMCTGCGCAVNGANTAKSKTNAVKADNKTSASLILGIIGIVGAWLFALVGHITSVIGIVLGIKEYKETEKMAGLILSIIGEVCSIFSSIIGAVTVASIF